MLSAARSARGSSFMVLEAREGMNCYVTRSLMYIYFSILQENRA